MIKMRRRENSRKYLFIRMLTVCSDGTTPAQLKSLSWVWKSEITAARKFNTSMGAKAAKFLCFGSGFKENMNGKW